MAAITPVASTVDGYVDPIRGLYTGIITAGQDILTDGSRVQDRNQFTTEIVYFSAISDDDTYATGIAGLQAVFFATDEGQTTADATGAHIDDAAGVVRFKVEAAASSSGWLLMFIDPIVSRRSGYPGR